MRRARRWRRAAQATLLGWVAGFIVTAPIQIIEMLRNSGPDLRLLVSVLGYGVTLWLLITFFCMVLVWLFAALPVSLFVREGWLLQHRIAVIAISICIGLVIVGDMVNVRGYFEHDGVGLLNFWIYACFAVVFAGVTAHSYLRFLAREQARLAGAIDLKR